jgi:PAS domain S-box-containing protein
MTKPNEVPNEVNVSQVDQRVPVLAPTGRDARLLCDVLNEAQMHPVRCGHITELCRTIAKGAGTAIITEEALTDTALRALEATLAHQPAWSDLPVIILRRRQRPAASYNLLPNATHLERPLSKAALIAAVRVALRARQRQYQIRAYVREREAAAEALKESEARFRGTFENAAVGIAHLGADGSWLRVNQRMCDMVGYTREELLKRTFPEMTHPDDLPRDLHLFGRLMRGEIDSYHVEKRYFHKEGYPVWISLTKTLQRDEQGRPLYSIAIIVDITEKKAAEAELKESEAAQRRLTAEIDHRAKNLLAVIQAMVRLSARHGTASDAFLEAFQDRLRALALTHTVLSEGRWRGASLRQIVSAEMGAFATEGRLTVDGDEDVVLQAKAAQDLTMALHELATNAAKYGALSVAGGSIEIRWRRNAEGGLTLDWRESGGPPVSPPSRSGFGRMVIQNAAGSKGSVAHRFEPAGVNCQIELPASALVVGASPGGRTP